MWLDLIQRISAKKEKSGDMLDQYLNVHEPNIALWHAQGGQAFRYHLNALLAYQPIQYL